MRFNEGSHSLELAFFEPMLIRAATCVIIEAPEIKFGTPLFNGSIKAKSLKKYEKYQMLTVRADELGNGAMV